MKKKNVLCTSVCLLFLLAGCNRVNPDSYCVVTFDPGQGVYDDTEDHKKFVTVKYNTMFSFASEQINPPTPFLDFYTFDGWTLGGKTVEDFPVTSNVTVVANYSYFGSINVTFDFNGGKYGKSPDNISLSFKKGTTWEEVTKPSVSSINPPNPSLEFEDWSFDEERLSPISDDYIIDKDLYVYAYYRPIFLTFTSDEDNSSISYSSDPDIDVSRIKTSINGSNWNNWDGSKITLDKGDSIRIQNENNTLSTDENYFNFGMTGKILASGNVESLVNYHDESDYRFYGLFKNCSSLILSPSLPAKKATKGCYRSMFENCNNLIVAPELPATSSANRCYQDMFKGCASLTRAPTKLPIKGLFYGSYSGMFENCVSLTKSPNILLTAAHEGDYCLTNMFAGCKSLTYIKLVNYRGDFNSSFNGWTNGVCPNDGELYYPGNDTSRGEDAIPLIWNVSPRFTLFVHLSNCTINPSNVKYHNGESVILKVTANDGYSLPKQITFTNENYNFDSTSGMLSFIALDTNSSLLIEATKNNSRL